jgi:hypothetical protein
VEGGICTAVNGKLDTYIDEWKVGYKQRREQGGIYTAVRGRWDLDSSEWEVGYIQQ